MREDSPLRDTPSRRRSMAFRQPLAAVLVTTATACVIWRESGRGVAQRAVLLPDAHFSSASVDSTFESSIEYGSYSYTLEDIEQTWEMITNVTNETSFWRTVVCPTASYALCDVAMCTLNSDGLTASCGCQKMDASEQNPANVGVGGSAILAFSSVYRNLLKVIEKHTHTFDLRVGAPTGRLSCAMRAHISLSALATALPPPSARARRARTG